MQATMRYELTTKDGKVIRFYMRELAELYQMFNGGILVDDKMQNALVLPNKPCKQRVI